MPHVRLNDIELYYEEHGEGTPLFLVHGFSGAGAVWADFVPTLAARYRVIVPDLRGHGRSGGPLATIHHKWFAADLVALMDTLQVERAHFVGHSSGGMSLLFIGQDHPQRIHSLTLASATYTFDDYAKRRMRYVAHELAPLPEAIANSQRLHSATHGPDHWKVHIQAFLAFTEDPQELPFTPESLAGIPCPVFVLHGDRDEIFLINIPVTLYRSLPNAELCILPATGHDLPTQHPQLFLDLVLRYLERHRQSEPKSETVSAG